ncbi:MAG: hypothetical protein JKX69_05330 [Rhodobacteraceae bacterium]|nr:hypothetical protein [Paracoccaceae bacterium]
MTGYSLNQAQIIAGLWRGVLVGGSELPQVIVTHLNTEIAGVEVSEHAGADNSWLIQVPIPVELVSEGVQTFIVRAADSGAVLATFTIIAGEVLAEDIRAEVDLLRAELDLLKRAFRRHCVEVAG